jgi:hypothetical protein
MKFGKFHTIGAIVQGATHKRNDAPCQDGLHIEHSKKFAIAAVADGHGSSSCPFSAQGAQMAVAVAADFLREIIARKDAAAYLRTEAELRIPRRLEAAWKDAIKSQYETEDYLLYGTTLLALAITDEFAFAVAIGDGDILQITDDVGATPLLPREENIGEETESLCMADAWRHVRTLLIPFDGAPPLFMLSTDGYSNSFTGAAGFIKAGTDFHAMWQDNPAQISDNLPDWLTATSERGSGDDIALALVGRNTVGREL